MMRTPKDLVGGVFAAVPAREADLERQGSASGPRRGDRRWLVIAVAVFAVVLLVALSGLGRSMSLYEYSWTPREEGISILHDFGGGLAFGIAGFLIWHRRPGNRTGPLMVLIGVSMLALTFEWVPVPPLVSLAQVAWSAPPVLIGALLLVYPTGRTRSPADLAWLAGAGLILLIGVVHALVTPIGIWECPDCHSWITLSWNETFSNDVWLLKQNLLGLSGVALIALLVRRWVSASRPLRRVMAPLWVAGLAYSLVLLTIIALDTSGFAPNIFSRLPNLGHILRLQAPPIAFMAMPYIATVALFLIPGSLLWGQVRSRWGQLAVSALAQQLRRADGSVPLVDSLRAAVGDPSLQLALWSRPAMAYVTPDGLPYTLPNADQERSVTRLDGTDGPLAAIVHDPALAEQRQLIDGVAAVAQLAIENERLHAEVKAQLEDVRASRERIVSAADEERRRVERNLHDGAQQRLVSLSMALRMAQAKAAEASPEVATTLAAAEAELKQAIGELRELARGIHPAILTEAGLGQALESLAEHTPLPVAVDVQLNGRLAPVVEATAYFVAAEALTNIAKHAHASAAKLRVTAGDHRLRILVVDNGVGGADPDRGSGIRGLTDRVAALGGTLRVDGAPGGGTELEAEIPCG